MLRILRVERDVATRGFCRARRCSGYAAAAVIDARGLQQQSVGRVEQARQGLDRGQVARQLGIEKAVPRMSMASRMLSTKPNPNAKRRVRDSTLRRADRGGHGGGGEWYEQ